ncbi:MAG: sigma-70 family RNA polymerase sigma factor [Acidobacteria bacterium]|nr:sigma-70 family RNA polymerase sigma factor [Acidobacteriota bacterium]
MQIAAGNAGALSDFYDEASRYVNAIAIRILREPEEAEEITLDVFQQVWRLAASYNPDRCAVTSWLGMMARSRALDRWRTLQTRRRFLAAEQYESIEYISPDSGPEKQVAATQRQQQIHRAMSNLPEEQRSIIALAFWEGLSHSEVAAKTGLPLGTVKTRIRLGMLKLKEELQHAGT